MLELFQNYNLFLILMKSEFKARPQSKRLREVRPSTSKHINKDQALVTFKQGKQEQAQQSFQKAIDLYLRATIYDPNYYQAFCNIGSCYRSLGQYMQARRFYKKSISIKRDDAISHYNLANVQRIVGDLQAAIQHYIFVISQKEQKKVEIGSLYLNSLINLGICYKNKQLYDKANECYQKALKIQSKEETALFNYGMTIVNSLRQLNSEIFQEVTKQKAQKALQIFTKYLQIYKVNEMAEFQLLRMSCLIDKSRQNITKNIDRMKKMLKSSSCSITDQINLELGYLSGLLKDYENAAAHYQKSISGFNHKKKDSQTIGDQNIYDNSNGFTSSKPVLRENKIFTEDEGVKMIEDGLLVEFKQQLSKLQDSNHTKHVLELSLQLYKIQMNQGNIKVAAGIYQKWFKKNGVQLADELISIEGHKAIGKLLSMQQKFKESIAHYQYISHLINSGQQKSKVHSSMANDYEALGDKAKAIHEYELALQNQPHSYELLYNMGCLLHEGLQHQKALGYFTKFLEEIQRDYSLDLSKKTIFIADCLVTMAECESQVQVHKPSLYNSYLKAWSALKELQVQGAQFQFEQKRIMLFFSSFADILQEKLESCKNKRTEEFISTKEKLLQVYVSLLQSNACPDRDAILNNCAQIYYEQKLYVNALSNYKLIFSDKVSSNSLALTYLHLSEHFMANKYIFLAVDDNSEDIVEKYNKQIISWIYNLSHEGKLYQKFKNYSDQALASRLQYGIYMIDAITSKLNELPQNHQFSLVNNILANVQKSEFLGEFYDQSQHFKLKAITKILNQKQPGSVDKVDTNYLIAALGRVSNLQHQFNEFLKKLASESDNTTQTVLQLYMNLFIFTHRDQSSTLRSVINKFDEKHVQNFSLNLDRRVTIMPELLIRSFGKSAGIKNIGDLVENIIIWECQLESKLVTILKTIDKYYYKSNIKRTLQIQHHFPRHKEWTECSSTLMKIIYFITDGLQIQPKFEIKGKNLNDAKYKLLAQIQQDLIKKINQNDEIKVILGDKFVPVSVFTFHETKKDCLQFLKELQKESSQKIEIELNKDCKEVTVLISEILRLRCIWEQPNAFNNSIKSYTQHAIPLQIQALVSLQSQLYILKSSSAKNKELLQQIQMFRD